MSVWYCIPSARSVEEAEPVLRMWAERGYQIALWRDQFAPFTRLANYQIVGPYPGYARAVNALVKAVLSLDADAEWIVTGGDDVLPDPNHQARDIEWQLAQHFYGSVDESASIYTAMQMSSFGVMQPTGDRWGENDRIPGKTGAYIDRVCGSPWLGREFCRRMYGGEGPLFSGYYHMYEDEELQRVAQKLGVLWQRPDLTHYHQHWGRSPGTHPAACPEHLKNVSVGESGRQHWTESKALFERREATGFPGHEPIP